VPIIAYVAEAPVSKERISLAGSGLKPPMLNIAPPIPVVLGPRISILAPPEGNEIVSLPTVTAPP
jgi:hypothetical protein